MPKNLPTPNTLHFMSHMSLICSLCGPPLPGYHLLLPSLLPLPLPFLPLLPLPLPHALQRLLLHLLFQIALLQKVRSFFLPRCNGLFLLLFVPVQDIALQILLLRSRLQRDEGVEIPLQRGQGGSAGRWGFIGGADGFDLRAQSGDLALPVVREEGVVFVRGGGGGGVRGGG